MSRRSMPTHLLLSLFSFVLLLKSSHSFSRRTLTSLDDVSIGLHLDTAWYPAAATWYGSENGGGSDGGACGYAYAVDQTPFSDVVSAVGPSLYQLGQGCGVCYELKCTENPACSGEPVTVTITDSCPGCNSDSAHFDMSGRAFGSMADSTKADQLRDAGILQVQYRRVDCKYPGVALTFHVDAGSNPFYFAAVIEYADGDGDVKSVELEEARSRGVWVPMQQLWGALWEIHSGSELQAPFSLRLTESKSGKSVVVRNVIPSGWEPGRTYRSVTNFGT